MSNQSSNKPPAPFDAIEDNTSYIDHDNFARHTNADETTTKMLDVDVDGEDEKQLLSSNSMQVAATPSNNNNFTQIQSRRYRQSIQFPCLQLCPSMDLIALGTSSNSNFISSALDGDSAYNNNNSGCLLSSSIAESIAVHRIISWQSLLQLKNDQLTSKSSQIVGGPENYGICVEDIERECVHETDNNNNDEDEDDDNLESLVKGATTVTWSPDGRNVAVGLVDGGILIHTVEPNNDNAHHEVGGTAGGDGGDGDGSQSILHIIRPPPTNLKDKPSILSPAAGSMNPTNLIEGDVTNNATISDNKQNKKKPTASPRVTRSMAAAREPGGGISGGGGSGSKKKSSRRSKSPGSSSSLSRRKPNLKVDTKNLLQSTAIGGTVVACFVTASNVLKSGEHTKSIPPPIPFIPPPAPPLSCCNPCSTLNIRY